MTQASTSGRGPESAPASPSASADGAAVAPGAHDHRVSRLPAVVALASLVVGAALGLREVLRHR